MISVIYTINIGNNEKRKKNLVIVLSPRPMEHSG